jgi:hypothetical protein
MPLRVRQEVQEVLPELGGPTSPNLSPRLGRNFSTQINTLPNLPNLPNLFPYIRMRV